MSVELVSVTLAPNLISKALCFESCTIRENDLILSHCASPLLHPRLHLFTSFLVDRVQRLFMVLESQQHALILFLFLCLSVLSVTFVCPRWMQSSLLDSISLLSDDQNCTVVAVCTVAPDFAFSPPRVIAQRLFFPFLFFFFFFFFCCCLTWRPCDGGPTWPRHPEHKRRPCWAFFSDQTAVRGSIDFLSAPARLLFVSLIKKRRKGGEKKGEDDKKMQLLKLEETERRPYRDNHRLM